MCAGPCLTDSSSCLGSWRLSGRDRTSVALTPNRSAEHLVVVCGVGRFVAYLLAQLRIARHHRRQRRDAQRVPRRSSTQAPTRSRSGSGRARSARPAWSPASAFPRSLRSYEASLAARLAGVPVIADGGLQYSGDIRKALVAGAQTASCSVRSSGPGGARTRPTWCSSTARGVRTTAVWARSAPCRPAARRPRTRATDTSRRMCPATSSYRRRHRGQVPFRGLLVASSYQLVGGLRSRCSMSVAAQSRSSGRAGKFVRITAAGLEESHPHDIQMVVEAPNYRR